jgi:5-methylcytosine-specific restriction protein A
MLIKFLDNFYRSPSWNKTRKEHLANFPECAACGRKDDLEVHHIVPYHVDSSRELDPNNLITLCDKYCHFIFGHLMDWKSWNVNVLEDSNTYRLAKQSRPKSIHYGQSYEKFSIFIVIRSIFNSFVCWYNRSN